MTAQVAAFLASIPPPPKRALEIDEVRQLGLESMLRTGGDPEPVAAVQDLQAGGVPARLYNPTGQEHDVLVWFHGGGWIAGSVESYDRVARALANAAGCAVLSVDYRLAPEHRYPAALEDCWAATEWASARFSGLAVGGDSSGGNLAAAIALRARGYDVPLSFQLLVYPVLDYSAVDGPFFRGYVDRYAELVGPSGEDSQTRIPWVGADHQTRIRWIWEQYIPDADRRLDVEASPIHAPSLAGVAPALIITAEHDILRGECEDYARRLGTEGVPVQLLNYERQVHGFFALPAVMDEGRDAIGKAGAALRQAFKN